MKKTLLAALLLAFTIAASANATVVTFDSLTNTSLQSFYGSYIESGYQFSATNFASWGSSNPGYAGSQALFNNYGDGLTTLTKVGGGSFDFNSINLSEVYNQSSYSPTTVVFNAVLAGGGSSSYTSRLDGVFGFQNFDFGSQFEEITSVSWSQTYNYHQFDNLVLDQSSAPVPEPGTMLLLGIGMGGLAIYGKRRKNNKI